ncbi:EscU/YscU/HrcU family type III secretion system export apparatus switch protein [Burkholderia gladioli]|uniref:EscU/YscU/HrcU family type III secretion system export apparatus switch protein n=1 Tax=Burkholderia gladioli TaxID=28095 RepID=UPI000D00D9B6|nr:EscU/YscU/HrcU family type III secretion system export apparatus switch protein [Burkholderia gladioli]MBJ9676674.1 EscU/YscU/HrcU family type III secretion system export apparatus switch protein [Burkholderia gladioli]MBU9265517.1 EscU/YscU/HrcU family type III secretion system export apparatus switch protein [Burkholderia gladioli]MBU9278181.1 EscU/YscU/HrcU family type III secretion system export apparatus switch protein [Burkholderia gladioli]MDN7465465.1 EscU/YscU/HrcU family type III s
MSGDKRKRAAALVYDPKGGDAAPRVVAKGYGLVAEMIVARAREAGLYVHTAPEMVSLLMQVDLDDRIPPALYQAVAELLAWLYALERAEPREAEGASAAGSGGKPEPGGEFPALPQPRR